MPATSRKRPPLGSLAITARTEFTFKKRISTLLEYMDEEA